MFGCKTEKEYKDKAAACLKGITRIKEILDNVKSPEKKAELSAYFAKDIKVLEDTYCYCREQYDKDFEDCRR